VKFGKPSLSFADQLCKLKTRGMIIADDAVAIQWLKSVSYYRLSAYFHPFKSIEGGYASGTDFETVCMLYEFDRQLRLLLIDAIERIEVALRTAVTYQLAINYGPFGHCDEKRFSAKFDHDRLMSELRYKEKESTESFVAHFRKKYIAEPHLPIWMASELMSMGTISRIYGALDPNLRRKIAGEFNTTDYFLCSWTHTLSYVRNLSAHHCRVWNRKLAIKPKLPVGMRWWPYTIDNNHSVYCVLIIAHHLVRAIAPHATWAARVQELIGQYPLVPVAAIGMPSKWRSMYPWNAVAGTTPKLFNEAKTSAVVETELSRLFK